MKKIEEFWKNPFHLVLQQCGQHQAYRKWENPQNILYHRYGKVVRY